VDPISMHLTLRNGLSVSLRIPSLSSIPKLLSELAELPCSGWHRAGGFLWR
jgi:hypothetical protein